MRQLYEMWKGVPVYFNWQSGQFETEHGTSSYVQSHARSAAIHEAGRMFYMD